MHKKFKAISGSLMAAAMLASSVAAFAVPVTANAGQLLGQTDFEDGTGLPWHTCETNPASQKFEITDDGKYVVTIVNPDGSDGRWDLQLRHRGLTIVSGHTYEVKAEVTASAAGYIYTKIGDYGGDNEYWNDCGNGNWKVYEFTGAGDTLKIDTTFVAGQGPKPVQDGPAEWAFHYANNNGKYDNNDTGMPAGSTLTFDNLSLIDKDGSDGDFDPKNEFGVVRPQSNVRLNQVGYYEQLRKRASYCTDASTPLTYSIYDKSGTKVYTNTASQVIENDTDSGTPSDAPTKLDGGVAGTKYKDSGKYVQILDFTDFTTGGEGYYIVVDDTTGVSGTRSGKREGAFDTTVSGGKVLWENWKTGVSYEMNKSHPFNIANTVYDGLLRDSINYFYQNRSGCPVDEKYISSGDKSSLAHSQYGHSPDTAYVQSAWVKAYGGEFDGDKKYSITATGGWYDAGDHGKYVVNGGVSVWTLQNMYEMTQKLGTDAKWTDGKTMLVPEGGDKVPDVLDEARVELDWMFDMIVKKDDPYYGSDAGLVYHKLHDHKWTGLAIHAWKYEGFKNMERIVKPPTYAATFNMIACAAQAARLWEPFDSAYAAECLEHAETSLAAVEKLKSKWDIAAGKSKQQDTPTGTSRGDDVYFAPLDQAIGGGPYGDTYVCDDYYWALCELYATTGKEEYLTKLKEYKNPNDSTGMDKALSLTSNLGGGENKGSFSSFNWGCTSGLGTLSLYLNSKKYVSDADHQTIVDSILKAADNYVEMEDKQGMGIPYVGSTFTDEINIGLDDNGKPIEVTGYEWGSNSFVANNAIVMAYAYDASGKIKYIDGASTAMDYIFGRNGNDFSYVSGYGDVALQYPHHRLWAHGVDPDFPMAPAGCLSGGPGAGMQDPYVGGLGYKRGTLASQKCYVDSAEAWSVNEITINWNAPLAWMTNYLQDVAPTITKRPGEGEDPTTAPPTPTDAPTTPAPTGGSSAKLWGDANEDNKVNVSDAVAVLQFICNKSKYALTEQGIANADVVDAGQGITGDDAIAIQKMDAGLIKQTDCPVSSTALKNFK